MTPLGYAIKRQKKVINIVFFQGQRLLNVLLVLTRIARDQSKCLAKIVIFIERKRGYSKRQTQVSTVR